MKSAKADQSFHRHELLAPSKLTPDQWMQDSCVMGSVDACVARLQEYEAVGIDEFALYGSNPMQNEKLIAAWRDR